MSVVPGHFGSESKTTLQSLSSPSVPTQTDDGQDPVNLIFTGYAPSWWIASNIVGWSDSAYCSSSKILNGREYNYTLEYPDPTGIACIGPRDHIRIWDMGYSPVFGYWSVGSGHHEQTVCNPNCHHVIDSWDRAEDDLATSILKSQVVQSTMNFSLRSPSYFQSVFDDGNATLIQLKPPVARYPVIFNERGLGNQTAWSVTVNSTTISSSTPDIVFEEANGTYIFTVGALPGFIESPGSGTLTIEGQGATRDLQFRIPWTRTSVVVNSTGRQVPIVFSGNVSIASSTVQVITGSTPEIRFSATEKGALGILNVTVPKSIVPSNTVIQAEVDGISENNIRVVTDDSNYYVAFLVVYGTHSVDLRFNPAMNPYIDYLIAAGVAGSILAALFLTFKVKLRKSRVPSMPDIG